MSGKFSIMTTINFDKLDKEIEEYIRRTGNHEPYIFMNEDTINAIANEFETEFGIPVTDTYSNVRLKDGVKATYTGHKVFANNDLKFGVVEIR